MFLLFEDKIKTQ